MTRATTLDIATLPLGPIGTNCYIARIAGSSDAVIVDPGDDAQRVLDHVRNNGLAVAGVLVTHCHYDHIGAVAQVARELGVEVWMSELEAPVLREPDAVWAGMGIEPHDPEHLLAGGETIELAGIRFDVLHLPGHSPGHLGFLHHGGVPSLFVGDVVFEGSIGRYDLPFSDGPTLFATIRTMLRDLDDATVLYPGHGPVTTMGTERRSNPFLLQLA